MIGTIGGTTTGGGVVVTIGGVPTGGGRNPGVIGTTGGKL